MTAPPCTHTGVRLPAGPLIDEKEMRLVEARLGLDMPLRPGEAWVVEPHGEGYDVRVETGKKRVTVHRCATEGELWAFVAGAWAAIESTMRRGVGYAARREPKQTIEETVRETPRPGRKKQ